MSATQRAKMFGASSSFWGLLWALGVFLGPTHAAAQLSLTTVVAGLSSPVFVTNAGDARLFIVEQGGRIRIYDPATGALRGTPFLDLVSKVSSGGERGLFSMAFHPDFASTRLFYVNYTNADGDTVIERYRVSADANQADASSGRTLMTITQPAPNHNGGQLQVGPRDGHLYIGMGDGGDANDPNCYAQRPDSLLGKMLRLDIRKNLDTAPYYGIPGDNPFLAAADPGNVVADEIWASGLRNPWRFSFDRATGDLYIADVGEAEREEIDVVAAGTGAGSNFGWKTMEGTHCNSTSACPASVPPCNSPLLTRPVFEYGHDLGCSITGGYVARGPRTPALTGQYIYADFCSRRIWALARRPDGSFQNAWITSADSNVRSFGEGADGRLYMLAGNELVELAATPAAVPATPAWSLVLAAALFGFASVLARGRAARSALAATLVSIAALCGMPSAVAAQTTVDGCSDAMYLDRTAAAADRTFVWDYAFAGDPERCIVVRVGQSVTWQGNFGDHPLDPDEGDTPNPITGKTGGVITFQRAGVYGYRCNFHFAMRGAVKVLPAATPASVPALGPAHVLALGLALLALSLKRQRA